MNLYKAIKQLHQELVADQDFVLKDDGQGPYILEWNTDFPKPTDDELQIAWEEIKDIPEPFTELETIKKQQADLTFQLMIAGVI